jgi:hypothetical protein
MHNNAQHPMVFKKYNSSMAAPVAAKWLAAWDDVVPEGH